MKLQGVIISVIICSIIALTLQLVGLILKHWMYAPSVVATVNKSNITFYSARGLWQSENKIVKYKFEGNDQIMDAGNTYSTILFKPAELEPWFEAVRVIEVIGAVLNFYAMIVSIFWYASAHKNGFKSSNCSSQYWILSSLILAGILDLLGVTILIGMLEPELASWGGTLCGLAGTFCIAGAAFVRYWQQEEFDLTK